MSSPHIPVLYREVVEAFKSVADATIVDCTLGYAGHTSLLLDSYPNAKLIGIDQDIDAIEFSSKLLEKYQDRSSIIKARYSQGIKEAFAKNSNIKGVLADIGVSSLQLDKKERGFSFNSPNLDMRMDRDAALSALDVLNSYSQSELERILREYGEMPNAKSIASKIAHTRPFTNTQDLLNSLDLKKTKKIHPATLLFQAIRIEVNDELGELRSLLDFLATTKPKGLIVAIISFHSLEDRIVKNYFAKWAKRCVCDDNAMRCECGNNNDLGKIVTKKPIMAKNDEMAQNPRSRSAKLRIFEFK